MKFIEVGGNFKRNESWDVYNSVRVRGGIVHNMTILPIPNINDDTYDGVYSEHFLEHLAKDDGVAFLKEMYRIMKPGATIRTIWPSMDFVDMLNSSNDHSSHPFVEMYNRYIIDRENPFNNQYYRSIVTVDQIASMSKQKKAALRLLHQEGEHKHLWYKQELMDCLADLGFKQCVECEYRKSGLAEFNNIDRDDPMRSLHSMVVEAIK